MGYREYLNKFTMTEFIPDYLLDKAKPKNSDAKNPEAKKPAAKKSVSKVVKSGRVSKLRPTKKAPPSTAVNKPQATKKAAPRSRAASPQAPALTTRAMAKKQSEPSSAVSATPSTVSDSADSQNNNIQAIADNKLKTIQPAAKTTLAGQNKRKASSMDSEAPTDANKKIKRSATAVQAKQTKSTKTTVTAAAIATPTPASDLAAAQTLISVATPQKSATDKAKPKKNGKKSGAAGTGKPEKTRTKEQKWGDYLKNYVGNAKDAYQMLPDLAVPALGTQIDNVPVRPYTFNKGKVQAYGDGTGLHDREQELAREVGLSYDAYRQQKRMAFIGYAAMQLEGKKDFKKSHTQSMCNIDGNKSTHLWVHFHDCWDWMPRDPAPAITTAALGDLELPDLHFV